MKKLFITIMIIIMGLCASAQSDGFFSSCGDFGSRTSDMIAPDFHMPQKPINSTDNEDAPLGSGLLMLTAFGAGYMLTKLKRE